MSIQYLEIDSTYRDRKKFPNPGQFDVIISQSGQKDRSNAIDPVSLASPIRTYIPNGFVNEYYHVGIDDSISYKGFSYIPINSTNSENSFILAIPSISRYYVSKLSNYYRTCKIVFYSIINPQFITQPVFTITIQTWDYLTTSFVNVDGDIFTPKAIIENQQVDYFRISFNESIDIDLYNTVCGVIFNISTDYTNGTVFIPDGEISSQIYKNWYIYNETTHESSIILAYDGTNSCASIEQRSFDISGHITLTTFPVIPSVRDVTVTLYNIIGNNYTEIKNGSTLYLTNPAELFFPIIVLNIVSYNSNKTINCVLRFIDLYPLEELENKHIFYLFSDRNWKLYHTISLRKELPISDSTFRVGSTTINVNLSLDSSRNVNDYIDSFIRITQVGFNKQQNRIIKTYSGYPNFTAMLDSPLILAPMEGDTYEILPFTRDNFTPFNYNGTLLSQDVCYEIQLINLIIPNVSMKQGGRPVSYPYFYVELEQYDSGIPNTIYSNNPNSFRKLFKVPVTDISVPYVNSFLTFDKSSMLKIIKFNPNKNFRFGVYLHDGRAWEPEEIDTNSPTIPNPNLQTSALFLLRRIQQ